jgi:hypothetical protein
MDSHECIEWDCTGDSCRRSAGYKIRTPGRPARSQQAPLAPTRSLPHNIMRFTAIIVAVAALATLVASVPLEERAPMCEIFPCTCHGQAGCCC